MPTVTPLDGTDPTLDLLLTFPSGTSGSSMRCVITDLEYESNRNYQSFPTLCSSNWEDELPGRRQDFIRFGKLATRGSVISDLGPLMGATNASAVTFTAYTGCTRIGLFWCGQDTMRVAAGQVGIPGNAILRSKGPVAYAWVIT